MLEAQRRNPHLTPTARPASTGNAEAELDRQARQMEREDRITYAAAYQRDCSRTRACTPPTWTSTCSRPEAAMAEFLIPRTIPKFTGTPVTALDPDDLRYILRHARRDRSPHTASAPSAVVCASPDPVPTYQPVFRRCRRPQRAIRPPAAWDPKRVPSLVAVDAGSPPGTGVRHSSINT
jgi:hypothetical protein